MLCNVRGMYWQNSRIPAILANKFKSQSSFYSTHSPLNWTHLLRGTYNAFKTLDKKVLSFSGNQASSDSISYSLKENLQPFKLFFSAGGRQESWKELDLVNEGWVRAICIVNHDLLACKIVLQKQNTFGPHNFSRRVVSNVE